MARPTGEKINKSSVPFALDFKNIPQSGDLGRGYNNEEEIGSPEDVGSISAGDANGNQGS